MRIVLSQTSFVHIVSILLHNGTKMKRHSDEIYLKKVNLFMLRKSQCLWATWTSHVFHYCMSVVQLAKCCIFLVIPLPSKWKYDCEPTVLADLKSPVPGLWRLIINCLSQLPLFYWKAEEWPIEMNNKLEIVFVVRLEIKPFLIRINTS
jgi:hypothetical protein